MVEWKKLGEMNELAYDNGNIRVFCSRFTIADIWKVNS